MKKIFRVVLIGLLFSSLATSAFATNRVVSKTSMSDPVNTERVVNVGASVAVVLYYI